MKRPGMRRRAIASCLWYGVLPWWMYEPTPHYDCGYWRHLWINIQYAFVWLTFRETAEDIAFELRTNGGLMNRNAPDGWWFGLSIRDAQQVMNRHASTLELRRIQSDRAPRTWWRSLDGSRRASIHAAEAAGSELSP